MARATYLEALSAAVFAGRQRRSAEGGRRGRALGSGLAAAYWWARPAAGWPGAADSRGLRRRDAGTLNATGMRREFDSVGDVGVPRANRYWGAQTQRSLQHFDIGHDRMPKEVYHAYGYVKKAPALMNTRVGRLPDWKGRLIQQVSSSSSRSMSPSPTAIRSFSATASRSASAARAVSAGLIGADDCSVPVIK
jgi:hypothetical protein